MPDTPNTAELLYADRDHQAQGEHYLRHIDHMTGEGLHAKSAIAAELAHRDIVIESLSAELEHCRKWGIAAHDAAAQWMTKAKAAEADLARVRAERVPEGWALVPVEPTNKMLDAAARASMQHLLDCINDPKRAKEVGSEAMTRKTHASRYRTMLAAASQPPAQPAPPSADARDGERLRSMLNHTLHDYAICCWSEDDGSWVCDGRAPDVVRAAIDAAADKENPQ